MTTPRLLPPHYFLLALLAIAALGSYGEPQLLPDWVVYPGVVLILTGFCVAVLASRQFSRAGTNIVPFSESTALVTDGMFAVTRNPMYLGMVLALAGLALVFGNVSPWLVVATFFAWIRQRFIVNEEVQMHETFGSAYARYQAQVRRWL